MRCVGHLSRAVLLFTPVRRLWLRLFSGQGSRVVIQVRPLVYHEPVQALVSEGMLRMNERCTSGFQYPTEVRDQRERS